MAVTVVDNRTILDQADSTTGWNTGAAVTSAFAESPSSIGVAYDTTTGLIYFDFNAINFTTAGNELIYVQSYTNALQNGWKEPTLSDSSHMMYLFDNTNSVELGLCEAGDDRDVFKHADNQVQFQSFVIDVDYLSTKNSNGEILEISGTFANFSATSISRVGSRFVTLSKALGGGVNCFVDIIRYGTGGLTIYGGGSGTEGQFSEIVTEDRSTTDQKGLGIIREYTANTYGTQGTLNFGTTTATGNAFFLDNNVSLTYEDRDVGDDKFKFVVQGNSTDTNDFRLSNSTIASARPGVTVDMSSTNINVLDLDTVNFLSLKNSVTFPTDSGTFTHTVDGCTFNACGQIDPGTVTFTNNSISSSTSSTTGALLIDSAANVSNWSGLSFTSGGSGHAIYITATGTYTFTDFTYSGFGAGGTTDAVVFNDSGGAVTINVSGGDTPTVRNGSGASTDVVSSVNVSVHVEDENGTAIEDAQVFIRKDGSYYDYTSHASNNTAGGSTFEVNEVVDTDLPQNGWLHVWDSSTNEKQEYRYQSWSGKIFTLRAEVTGSATSTGSSTSLVSTSTDFTTADIEEGDTIRNTTDGSWAIVDEIVDADNITTTELQDGADNTWESSDAFSLHRLAVTYESADLVDIPLFNGQTNASGDISTTFGGATPVSITVRIRSNEGTTKFVPFNTSGTIESTGFSLTAVLTEDTVAS